MPTYREVSISSIKKLLDNKELLEDLSRGIPKNLKLGKAFLEDGAVVACNTIMQRLLLNGALNPDMDIAVPKAMWEELIINTLCVMLTENKDPMIKNELYRRKFKDMLSCIEYYILGTPRQEQELESEVNK